MQMSSIGQRLREERKKLGKNQTEFGALGGVLMGAQINYEQDKRQPDAAYLSSIAANGADVLYILTGQRSLCDNDLSPDEAALLDNFRAISAERKFSLIDVASALASVHGDKKQAR